MFLPVASEMPSSAAFRELKELPRDVLRAELSTFVRTGVSTEPASASWPSLWRDVRPAHLASTPA